MSTISYKCPNCGGDLRFDPDSQKFKCEYCDTIFTQEELENANPQERPEQNQEKEEQQKDENGAVIYTCPNCGAEIVTDATTAAMFCYYCHNPVVLSGRLSGEYEPDLVIPFSLDKKAAIEKFLSYVKKKRFVPVDFFCKEQIEKISGVYFPFWVYSCDVDGEWHGKGNRVRVYRMGDIEYTETKVFAIDKTADLNFEKLTRNALNKENKQLVEAVQPFRLEETKPFAMSYLAGFMAEKRNIEKMDLMSDIRNEVQQHSTDMIKSSVQGYSTLTTISENMNIVSDQWKYLLVPVWVLTYKGKDGKLYYYAMNGQTQKICGVLPMDKKRVLQLFFGIFFMVFILLMLGGYFLW